MATDSSAERVVHDARLLLATVRDEVAAGRRPYISDIRRLVERSLALRHAEYVQFLEKYGFLTLDRRSNLLALTRAGGEVAAGEAARCKALVGDARYHFGERLPTAPAPTRAAANEASRLDTRFLKLEPLGRGGLGTVYTGRLLSVDRPIAIKVMEGLEELFRPEQQEEVRRRLELAVREHASLVSPFIVQILDQNPRHHPPYYVMELAHGGDLRHLLDAGRLPPMVAMRYFVQIALGLQAAHHAGVLHRDLKPDNVLLDERGNVKLTDFGIIRVAEQDGARVRQAYVGYGSVGYMAPETFRPGARLGPQADIYALGILLYEMLVGELPGRRSPLPSEVVEGVPSDLDDIFDRMTQDQPERRPESLDALLTEIWTSPDLVALFDARQAPLFPEPPVALPGLSGGASATAPVGVETPEAAPVEAPAEPTQAELTPSEPTPAEPPPSEPTPAEVELDAEPIAATGAGAWSAADEPTPESAPEPAFFAENDAATTPPPAMAPPVLDEDEAAALDDEEDEETALFEAAAAPPNAAPGPEPAEAAAAPAGADPGVFLPPEDDGVAVARPFVVGAPSPVDFDPDETREARTPMRFEQGPPVPDEIEELDGAAFIEVDEEEGADPRGSTQVTRLGVESNTRQAIDEKLRRLRKRT